MPLEVRRFAAISLRFRGKLGGFRSTYGLWMGEKRPSCDQTQREILRHINRTCEKYNGLTPSHILAIVAPAGPEPEAKTPAAQEIAQSTKYEP